VSASGRRTPATEVATLTAGPALAQREPPALPAVDRYVLDREIAQGGMGRIYAGRDVRLGREVAIKVLIGRDDGLARRFEREALVAARLQHPGIVTVYDAGFWPTGEPFLVMRLVLGRSLEKVIGEAETPAERIALLPHLIAVADALAYAHDQGIVHRDLKPSNVIVGAFGETVVVDWGLAKDLRAEELEPAVAAEAAPSPSPPRPPTLTQDGAVIGTPAYMAPEQAAGRPVDARADVYALGAILYQTLAGTPPSPLSSADGVPARPPVSLARLEPRAPAQLQAIVAKAMAAAPADRFPSAFELAEELKRFQTGQLLAVRRSSVTVALVAVAVACVLALARC
jgi:serine/threonine protein kinase